jgi:hypothetical protein
MALTEAEEKVRFAEVLRLRRTQGKDMRLSDAGEMVDLNAPVEPEQKPKPRRRARPKAKPKPKVAPKPHLEKVVRRKPTTKPKRKGGRK